MEINGKEWNGKFDLPPTVVENQIRQYQPKSFKNTSQWDKKNSTWKWYTYLDNRENPLTGYSKKIDENEGGNPRARLINTILRLYKDGYLDDRNANAPNVYKMDYFHNKKDVFLFCLHKTFVEWGYVNEEVDDGFWAPVVIFINSFYALINEGKSAEEIQNKLMHRGRTRAPKRNPLDVSTHRFKTVEDLAKYGVHLQYHEKKVTPEQRVNFLKEYAETWLGIEVIISEVEDDFHVRFKKK